MANYDTGTAIHFIVFAILFGLVFAFATWRIVRNLEKEDEAATSEEAVGCNGAEKTHKNESPDQ